MWATMMARGALLAGSCGVANRTFVLVVILLWASTTAWLVVSKILPPLLVGEPPTYRSTLSIDEPIVCWQLTWNDQPVGWAATRIARRPGGVQELHSRLVIDQLPLDELAPAWLGAVVRPLLEQAGRIDMDARSRIEIDPLGNLSGLRCTVNLPEMPNAIRMRGQVENSRLKFQIQSGDFAYQTEKYLAPGALVTGEMSPQAELPGIRVGQKWTTPVYSVFRSPGNPVGIVQAEVEREEVLEWHGETIRCRVVVYRSDSGAAFSGGESPHGLLWVRHDGKVLQQEVLVFNSRLRFVRLPRAAARAYAGQLEQDWLAEFSADWLEKGDADPIPLDLPLPGFSP